MTTVLELLCILNTCCCQQRNAYANPKPKNLIAVYKVTLKRQKVKKGTMLC